MSCKANTQLSLKQVNTKDKINFYCLQHETSGLQGLNLTTKRIQLNLSTAANLGTEENDRCRVVETRVNV